MSDSAFRHLSATPVESLNLVVHHYEHTGTGAVHYHLESDHDEKAFMVAVRTMPKDSTGVAHILEHTVLCGSEKFPVRDPFFMMTRRSLNTFMNAMTSSDWTAYPFASQNDKDFNNLLDVYLDAVFFSRLHPLDFAQEGHRLELEDPQDPNSKLVFKGVVFNEMKGAMSSPVSQLWQGISAYLFPTTTYHFNSGGDPAEITQLSYEQLMSFYKSHYHPSNAVFMTFGNLDVDALQARLESEVLSRFERQTQRWSVPAEQRYAAPVAVQEYYGVDSDDLSGKTHHVTGWLLGSSVDLDAQLEANLLSQILLDNSASPLRRALEQTELGGSPSPLCGLEESNHEMSFMCGVEGSEPEHGQAIETLILDTLQQIATDGVDADIVESALHQLELHQREIGGDHYPYGLQLVFNALPAAIHHGDPVAMLNLDPALARLRANASQPGWVQATVTRLLLNNRHRVRYSLLPDAGLNAEAKRLEQQRLDTIRANLTEQQLQAIRDQAEALQQRQAAEDDPGLLPQVTLEDVKPDIHYVAPDNHYTDTLTTTEYVTGTNGILYQQLIVGLPAFNAEQLSWLPMFTNAWSEVGAGGNDYLTQQIKQTALVGSLSSYASIRGDVDSNQHLHGHLVMSGKALGSKAEDFSALMKETWQTPTFDDNARLLDLMTQMKARREQGVTGSGHSLAMSVAASTLNPVANITNIMTGMPQLVELKQRLKQAQQDGGASLSAALNSLYACIASSPDEALLIHDAPYREIHLDALQQQWPQTSASTPIDLPWTPVASANYWMVDSQVNFCAWALPTVSMVNEDAAALSVLAGVMRNAYLHTAIREKGGAYGAGATQDNSSSCFKFYSYRDPRVEGTFDDFAASIDWVLERTNGDDLVEQAVLGLIGGMDRPGSPAGEAKQAFHMDRGGRTRALRQQYRERLLSIRWSDVQRVAATYLQGQEGSKAVIAPRGTQDIAAALGLTAQDF
ncbi:MULTISPECIES: insulinase family protein [unclassified Oceanobacter]|uniref:insulinase family protein n=1 Tax=unclassified Oceanobacter TaxID=2620260 RepID=UPI002734A48D|nr:MULTISPECIES: insulinase family protein [unclassified Oceanobacter]MDP2608712.1 insulinase family protein [Oceanobacter sp. 1_MG-2023]MDP2611808.1 insulinase family protein [Oceanobacter sp. 2_MG-2023]